MLELLLTGLTEVLKPFNILMGFVGTILGLILGALPGIGPPLAISLLLPLIFGIDPVSGTVLMLAVFNASVYGGSISAILINTPGTPGSIATCFDGYPMARQGRAGEALGASLISSVIGGLITTIFFISLLGPIARLSLKFGPSQMFLIILLSLGTVSRLATGSLLKGIISSGIGILLGLIGYDLMSGVSRFSFGYKYLQGGLHIVVTLIGWFAITELLFLVQMKTTTISSSKLKIGTAINGAKESLKHLRLIGTSSIIGAFLGALPGIGIALANLVAYGNAKSNSKYPEKFGTGIIEGVIAPEAANNAVTGCSLIPTLALAIPGGATLAVILGGLMILGVTPGPRLVNEDPRLIGSIMVSLVFINFLILFIGFLLVNLYQYITRVKIAYIVPIILAISFFGAYITRYYIADIFFIIALGLLAYGMRKAKYSIPCMVLGFVLSKMLEENFHKSLLISDKGYLIFLEWPVNALIVLIGVLIYLFPFLKQLRLKKNRLS
ncbi:MAG: tripartite tricarboxylate transporter permease [Deltaproteobacteria bacterium]|nr:tripartite tricarboxylate transporter permease [Deltaproteobacteria bacterium]MBW2154050.1 tripartite tricarboxylate transporter permease [Deltaproteobacteria bacterium]